MANKKYKVAVYGSLRKGMSNHRLLEGTEFLGTIETPPKYTMYSVNLMFPALKQRGTTSLKMEVYEVNEAQLGRVDILEGYRSDRASELNHYERFTIKTPFGDAYCYEYNRPTNTMYTVDSGDWVAFKKNHEGIND